MVVGATAAVVTGMEARVLKARVAATERAGC